MASEEAINIKTIAVNPTEDTQSSHSAEKEKNPKNAMEEKEKLAEMPPGTTIRSKTTTSLHRSQPASPRPKPSRLPPPKAFGTTFIAPVSTQHPARNSNNSPSKSSKPTPCPLTPGRPQSTRSTITMRSIGDAKSARERVAEKNRIKIFENLEKSLLDMQSEFMNKLHNLKLSSPDKIKKDFKFVAVVHNDDCKLMVREEDLAKLPRKLPVDSVADFKAKVTKHMDASVSAMLQIVQKIPIRDKLTEKRLAEAQESLKADKETRLNEILHYIDILCSGTSSVTEDMIEKLKTDLHNTKTSLQEAENKMQEMLAAHTQETDALRAELSKESHYKISEKDAEIEKLKSRMKDIEVENEKLILTADEIQVQMQHRSVEEKKHLMMELQACQSSMQDSMTQIQTLQTDLLVEKQARLEYQANMKKKDEELTETMGNLEKSRLIRMQVQGRVDKLLRELDEHSEKLKQTEEQRRTLLNQLCQIKAENERLSKYEVELEKANKYIEELGKKIAAMDEEKQHLPTKEDMLELARLRQSETEKKREIENLRSEIQKSQAVLHAMREKRENDRQLLEVRNNLITTLQNNDTTNQETLDKAFAKIIDKSNIITELNTELQQKSEEFRNLFTTLSSKQAELGRQQHIIRLLEDGNERSQLLRVKQEEKIARMEGEINELRKLLTHYQTGARGYAPVPVSPNRGTIGHLESPSGSPVLSPVRGERYRKRNVDINVKKYET